MLTKTDLNQIDKLLVKRVDEVVTKRVDEIVTKKLKPMKEDVSQIRKDIKLIVSFFDREYIALRRRVERIEEHLNLAPLSS